MTDETQSNRLRAWITILTFMLILICLSAIAHFAVVALNPSDLYVGALMWCPAVAAFVTWKIRGQSMSTLSWKAGTGKLSLQAYFVPVLYVTIAYVLSWSLGLADIQFGSAISSWSSELGLEETNQLGALLVMILLLSTIGVLNAAATILGEEIGWRGLLIWELRKLFSFGWVAIISGLIWAVWHFPIIYTYGGDDRFTYMAFFTIMIVGMSVVMTYFTFKSGSIWPAVAFHGANNVYIQQIFTPLTVETESSAFWVNEYGLMIPIIVWLFAIYFWRRARRENM